MTPNFNDFFCYRGKTLRDERSGMGKQKESRVERDMRKVDRNATIWLSGIPSTGCAPHPLYTWGQWGENVKRCKEIWRAAVLPNRRSGEQRPPRKFQFSQEQRLPGTLCNKFVYDSNVYIRALYNKTYMIKFYIIWSPPLKPRAPCELPPSPSGAPSPSLDNNLWHNSFCIFGICHVWPPIYRGPIYSALYIAPYITHL